MIEELLAPVGIIIGVLWGIFLLDWILPFISLFEIWGLQPRNLFKLHTILTSTLVHGSWGHLIANSIPLVILLSLLRLTGKSMTKVAEVVVLAGGLLWLFGRSGGGGIVFVHGGASGVIFGLITLLMVVGFVQKKWFPIVVGLGVGYFYGWGLLAGIMPTQSAVSWDGHLWGAVAGIVVGLLHIDEDR